MDPPEGETEEDRLRVSLKARNLRSLCMKVLSWIVLPVLIAVCVLGAIGGVLQDRDLQDVPRGTLESVSQEPPRVGPDPAFANTHTPLRNWAPYTSFEQVDRHFRAQYVFSLQERKSLQMTILDLKARCNELDDRIHALENR